MKPGSLDDEERVEMQTQTMESRHIIDQMLGNFRLEGMASVDVLRNIAELHHNAVNGSGYPRRLKGGEIPMEPRIVAVAEVFDAPTSRRPYQRAWRTEAALRALQKPLGIKLDAGCVAALVDSPQEIDSIQRKFREAPYG